jgi:CheY-like chemotaxis protein
MTSRKHILMVDDELQNLDTFRRAYRKYFDISLAQSGAVGLQLLADHQFDVVLSDYGMPGMSGAEFVIEAKRVQRVAIVMVTGYFDKPEVVELEASGAVFTVVGKPWDKETLLGVIDRASEATQEMRRKA